MDQDQTSGNDHAKAIVAALCIAAPCIAIIGIIPALILFSGAWIAFRKNDPSIIRATTPWAQGAAIAIALLITIPIINEGGNDTAGGLLAVLVGAGLYFYVLETLWKEPMARIVAERGTKSRTSAAADIIKRDALSSYSVADELRKWRDLRDDGTVTEDEFQAARARIMK